MSEFNNDFVEAAIEEIEEPTPAVEEIAEVALDVAVEDKVEDTPVVEKKAKKEPKASVANDDLVAVFSRGNISWDGVGVLSSGYNLVSKINADKWVTVKGVRLATPEEVAAKVAK